MVGMKERPLLFTPENAQKSHVGTKTNTRRLNGLDEVNKSPDDWTVLPHRDDSQLWTFAHGNTPKRTSRILSIKCPYGVPGDRLWVREAWADVHPLQADGRFSMPGRAGIPGPPPVDYRVIYRGEGEYPRLHFQEGERDYPYRELCQPGCQRKHIHPEESQHGWNPSIHMPRWACRTVLEITDIRVERLKDISQADAIAEGAPPSHPSINKVSRDYGYPDFPRSWYAQLWDSINDEGSWSANPFVWAITFRKVTP